MSCELAITGLQKRRVSVSGIEYEYDTAQNNCDASTEIYFNQVGSLQTWKAGVRNFYIEDGCVGTTSTGRLGYTMDDVAREAISAWIAGNRTKLLPASKDSVKELSYGA
jgi:hypothetical protein